MPASRYKPEPEPFLTDIMVGATLPALNREASKIRNAAQSLAFSTFGADKDDDGESYVASVQLLGTERLNWRFGPRSAVLVGATVPYAFRIEQRYAIIAKAAGAGLGR